MNLRSRQNLLIRLFARSQQQDRKYFSERFLLGLQQFHASIMLNKILTSWRWRFGTGKQPIDATTALMERASLAFDTRQVSKPFSMIQSGRLGQGSVKIRLPDVAPVPLLLQEGISLFYSNNGPPPRQSTPIRQPYSPSSGSESPIQTQCLFLGKDRSQNVHAVAKFSSFHNYEALCVMSYVSILRISHGAVFPILRTR